MNPWTAHCVVLKEHVPEDGIMGEVRKREHYDKPSVKRKKKSEAARKRKFR